MFITQLCIDNAAFAPVVDKERHFDVMYCGQLNARKMPHFFVDVIDKNHTERPNLRVLLLGDGPLRGSRSC